MTLATAARSLVLASVLVVVALSVQAPSNAQAAKGSRLVVSATYKGYVYVAVTKPPTKELHLLCSSISGGPSQRSISHAVGNAMENRWRIAHDQLWVNSRSAASGTGHRCYRLSLPALLQGRRSYGPDADTVRGVQEFVRGKNPLIDMVAGTSDVKGAAYYDYVPLSPTKLRLYILSRAASWTLRSIDYTAHHKGTTWVAGKWSNEQEYEAAFREPFLAFCLYNMHHFVTLSGKVYCCLAFRGKEPHKLVTVWDRPDRPVNHVLLDADNRQAYVFGNWPHRTSKKDFFFQLLGVTANPTLFWSAGIKSC